MNKLIEVDSVTQTENESSQKIDKEYKIKAAILEKFGFNKCDPTVIKTLMGAKLGDFHRYRTNCFHTQDDRVKSHAAKIRRARSVSYNADEEHIDLKQI